MLLPACHASVRHQWIHADGAGPIEIATEDAPSLFRAHKGDEAPRVVLPGPTPRQRNPDLQRLEDFDAELREALSALSAAETSRNHVRVAQAYRRLQVFDDAVDHFDRALKLEPKDISALDGRARLWRDVGMLQWALLDITRAIYIAPDHPALHNTRGTILEALGQKREAAASYARAVSLDPGAEYARRNFCRVAAITADADGSVCPEALGQSRP